MDLHHKSWPVVYFVRAKIQKRSKEICSQPTDPSNREFLADRLILGRLWEETVCSIVRPYDRVHSHSALIGTITVYFQPGEQWHSKILTSSFCWRREEGRANSVEFPTETDFLPGEGDGADASAPAEQRKTTLLIEEKWSLLQKHGHLLWFVTTMELCNYCCVKRTEKLHLIWGDLLNQ